MATSKQPPSKKKLNKARLEGNIINANLLSNNLLLIIVSISIVIFNKDKILSYFLDFSSSCLIIRCDKNKSILLFLIVIITIGFPLVVITLKIIIKLLISHFLNCGYKSNRLNFIDISNFFQNFTEIVKRIVKYEKLLLNIATLFSSVTFLYLALSLLTYYKHTPFFDTHSVFNLQIKKLINFDSQFLIVFLLFLGFLAVFETVIISFHYKKSLGMTKEEVRRELKDEDGSSNIKRFQVTLQEELLYTTLEEKVKRSKVILIDYN